MKRWYVTGVIILFLIRLGAAQPPSGAETYVDLGAEDVVGAVLEPDGETPIVDLPIRVWSETRQRMVGRTRTDQSGSFRISLARAGKYQLLIGRVRVGISVQTTERGAIHQHHDVVVVLPEKLILVASPQVGDLLLAPFLMKPPESPTVVSP